jgi:hypothetical protein
MIEPDACRRTVRGGRHKRRRMRLLDFQPMRNEKLFGFAKPELPNGLRTRDIPILGGKHGAVSTLAPRPMLDQEGDGSAISRADRPFLGWRDRRFAGCFSGAGVAFIIQSHPGALDAGEP